VRNREQIRAASALAALEKYQNLRGRGGDEEREGGDVVSGFPALIRNNGLLASLAFCRATGGGHENIGHCIAEHLASPDIALLGGARPNLDGLLSALTQGTSAHLRLCTAETLAYLDYLKRFAKASDRAKKTARNGR
jgi:CRISPR/Cas system CMR-associated protein Cmr5 small subunit